MSAPQPREGVWWELPKSRSGPSSMCPARRERSIGKAVSGGPAGWRTDTHNTSYNLRRTSSATAPYWAIRWLF